MRRLSLIFTASTGLWHVLLAGGLVGTTIAAQPTITVDPTVRHQTIQGWECVSFASQDHPSFPTFRDEVLRRLVTEAGINRVRLEVRSGAENSVDYFARYQAGEVDYATWRANRYATTNDNADPNVIDPAGFHFTELDRNVSTTILPLRAIAAEKGEPLYINLNYVAFTSQIQGGTYHHQNAAEYAEFILAAFQHLDQQFGFVPNALEILLEPDNVSQWNGTTLGNAIAAVETRLKAAGYAPEIIAPSCTHMGNAVQYFDALAAVPGALTALDEICYHRYGGVTDANLQALAARGQQHNKRTSMLEWWSTGNGIDVLFKDLTMGRNGAWQQGAIAGTGALDDNMTLYMVDVTNPAAPSVRINRKTRLLRQVYRFVRRGATRVAASSTNNVFQPLAFVNAGGEHVAVVRATAGGSFSVGGLPPGAYGINYSTATEFSVELPGKSLAPGGFLSTGIPQAGVITIYQLKSTVSATRSAGESIQVSVRSLRPNFAGSIERNPDVANPNGWQQVYTTPASDFRADWSATIGAGAAFYRFHLPLQ